MYMPLVYSVVIDLSFPKKPRAQTLLRFLSPKKNTLLPSFPLFEKYAKYATKNRNASVTTMLLPVAMPHLFPMMPRQLRNIPHPIEGVAPAHGNKVKEHQGGTEKSNSGKLKYCRSRSYLHD